MNFFFPGQYDDHSIDKIVQDIMQAGGFPDEEPLDSIARIIPPGKTQIPNHLVCHYSWTLSRYQQWDRAEAVARSIQDDPDEQGQALAILASDLARAGLFDRARAIAISIPNLSNCPGAVSEKAAALVLLAKKLRYHPLSEVQEIINEAQLALASIDRFGHVEINLLTELADVYFGKKERTRATELINLALEMSNQCNLGCQILGLTFDLEVVKSLEYIAMVLREHQEIEWAQKVEKHLQALYQEARKQRFS
ncbi:MAG: hypothetical protein HY774_27115 [Acidobacteria bacterium]|nr:hypothetical protein [Acidobacteriota bacterium]